MPQPPPLSLYVHLPWCVSKCPYCDFNSHGLRGELPQARYVDALLADLDCELPLLADRRIETVFFGGGTPSLFSPEAVGRLLGAMHAAVPCAADLEVTLEANPGTVEHGRFAEYRAAGVNRLSIGAQSFDAALLGRLGRIHGPAEIHRAVAEARAAGFDNLNLDLMYGLPGQSVEAALLDLQTACRLEPEHLSYYQLTIEPGTRYARDPPALPDEESCWQMHSQGLETLADAGLERYEISAYARPGAACRHNLNVWRFGDYVGCGAGAHGKLTVGGRIRRSARIRSPARYMGAALAALPLGEVWFVEPADAAFEYMLNVLRLIEGFVEADLAERTGLSPQRLRAPLQAAHGRGLLVQAGAAGRWCPSELGLRFLSDLQALFLPEEASGRPRVQP